MYLCTDTFVKFSASCRQTDMSGVLFIVLYFDHLENILLKGVLHLWALFLKVLCIFSKNKATSDKVSYGSGQKCSKELKNHNFTSV